MFLNEPRWYGHNHGLFHAVSLYNIARAFPWLEGAAGWQHRARERIHELLGEMVDVQGGVSLEQSFGYHFKVLDLFWRLFGWLDRVGDPATDLEARVLGRMTEVGAAMIGPNGSLPAVGDTWYGARPVVAPLLDPTIAGPVATYVTSHGRSGRPPTTPLFLPVAGYAIFGAAGRDGPDPSLRTQVVIDAGPTVKGHGHQDALHVTFAAAGSDILIDPGGPYIYRFPERQRFLESRVHNGVVVDGVSFDDEHGQGDVTWSQAASVGGVPVLTAYHDKYPTVRVARSVLLLAPDTLVILDRLLPSGIREHDYSVRFQLAPGARVRDAAGGRLVTANGTSVSVATRSNVADGIALRAGTGRVTTGPAVAVPAPTLTADFRGADAWLLTVLVPNDVASIETATVDGQTTARIRAGATSARIVFGPGSQGICVEGDDDAANCR